MKNKVIFFILFSFILQFSFSQTIKQKELDSLYTVITNGKDAYANKGSKELLRLCTEIYYQSKEIGYETGQLNALVKMSEIYRNEHNYQESLNKIEEGIKLAEKLNNYLMWSNLLMLESGIYPELGYYKKSRTSSQKALLIADRISESDKRHSLKASIYRQIANNIEDEDKLVNKYDSVLFYHFEAYNESRKLSDQYPRKNRLIAKNAKNIGAVYVQLNKLKEAEKYLNEFEALTKDENHHPNFISYYILKGKIENKKTNYKKAIEYFEKSIDLSHEYNILPSELIESYSGIAASYGGLQDFKNQAFYLEKAKKISDSLNLAEKKIIEKIATSPIDKKEEFSVTKYIFFGIGAILLLLLLIYFLIKNKKSNIIKVESSSEVLKPVVVEEEIEVEVDSQKLNQVMDLARNNDESFYIKFLELFPKFSQSLLTINPQLTPSDLEYCALMKLNFDTKQIATFKKSSVNSVESKKYRIRKKLNIGTHENMYVWLMDI